MERDLDVATNLSIYDSLEALDAYLNDIRTRRDQRRQARLEGERLGAAITKISNELEAARQDNDTDIVVELQSVLAEFERRLGVALALTSQAVVYAAPRVSLDQKLAQEPLAEEEAPVSVEAPVTLPVSTVLESASEMEGAPSSPAVVVISEKEIEAQTRAWCDEIAALSTRWGELDKEGLRQEDKPLNRPACLQMRSFACTLARIQRQGQEAGMPPQVMRAVTELRDKMELARTYAQDTFCAMPFDQKFWTDDTSRLTAEAWDELAHLYGDVAEAQQAWDWYWPAREELENGTQHALLNAIGAIQQMLFRVLDENGGSDSLQGDLYGYLRGAASVVGFLSSLNPETAWAELEKLGRMLPTLYKTAQQEAASAQEKRQKEARKSEAIQAVLQWQQRLPALPLLEASLEEEKGKLLSLLDECLTAGVPPTNVQVRGAILHIAPLLLKDLPPYVKFLEAVVAERKRKGLDLIPIVETNGGEDEEDLPDSQIAESKEWVKALAEGQKVLILGGSSRLQVAEKLKLFLQCANVEWLDSKKGDRMSKFKMQINRADVLVIVKKFASHEMTEKSRDWAKESGKHFVLLPSGYGVNQIIHQMYLQLVHPDASKKIAALPPKSSGLRVSELNLA